MLLLKHAQGRLMLAAFVPDIPEIVERTEGAQLGHRAHWNAQIALPEQPL